MVKMADCSDGSDPNLDDECIEKVLFNAGIRNLEEGDTWYLVPKEWIEDWKKYLEKDPPGCEPPGCIDLTSLLDEENKEELRLNLVEELDYSLVPEDCWLKLEKRFGVKDGQKPISRKVIEFGAIKVSKRVEVYFPEIELMKDFDEKTRKKVKVSILEKSSKIGALAKELYKVDRDVPTHLWVRNPTRFHFESVRDSGDTSNIGVAPGTIYVLETQHDGKWPSEDKNIEDKIKGASEIGSGIGDKGRTLEKYRSRKPGGSSVGPSSLISSLSTIENNHLNTNGVRGVCGLNNLGNTCFMNSVLQCLSNTPPLVKYFLDDSYINDLNEKNPLGMQGEIARSFADLIKQMWSGVAVASPISFKAAVSKFATQFYGFQQHDAQELLTFLLDGLHEDLNRIREKPYINLRDSDNRPDDEVAKEAWDNYLKRNDSVIVDLFHGQLKSTVVCPKCNMISVTFDPFCYLSLPLPPKDKEIEVVLYPYYHYEQPTRYRLNVPCRGTISDLLRALSEITPYEKNHLVATEVKNSHFHKIFSSTDALDTCNTYKIYQLPHAVNDPTYVALPVHHAVLENSNGSLSEMGEQEFGVPIFVMVNRTECTYKKFYDELLKRLRYYVNPKALKGGSQIMANGSSTSSAYNHPKDGEELDSDDFEDGDLEDSDDDKDSKREDNNYSDLMDVENSELEFALVNNRGSDPMETDNASDEGEGEGDDESKYFSVFIFGNADKDLQPLIPPNMDDLLSFPKNIGQQTIVLVWPPKWRKALYRESLVNRFKSHSSCNSRCKTTQLTDCLALYTREEQLDATDAWYCPKCKDHIEATKKFDVWKLPKILVVHLKRFQYNRYRRDKIDTLIDFPITGLDLKEYVIDPNNKHSTTYDLIGICNHFGSLVGGHYTAFGLNREKNEWYTFDDTHVRPVGNTRELVRSPAYVLFYQRRDEDDV